MAESQDIAALQAATNAAVESLLEGPVAEVARLYREELADARARRPEEALPLGHPRWHAYRAGMWLERYRNHEDRAALQSAGMHVLLGLTAHDEREAAGAPPGPPLTPPTLQDLLALSRLVLRLGRVERVTTDAEGRPETDTTHSLMLALLAGALAPHEVAPLDRDLVVALALIHDIAEAYAGDVSTMRALSPSVAAHKAAQEAAALGRIRGELSGFPWILSLIDHYEGQRSPEARFVRTLDKIMPKLTHADTGCAVPIAAGMTREEIVTRHAEQGAKLKAAAPELELAHALFAEASANAEACWGQA